MFLERITDKIYGTYMPMTEIKRGIDVKCPNCSKRGIVSEQKMFYQFVCTNCNKSMKKEKVDYVYKVENNCEKCGRYYRVEIKDEKQKTYPEIYVECNYCKHVMKGNVQKTKQVYYGYLESVHKGTELIFGLELWFLDYFDGKPIWALNREHLEYLIEYLSAKLREKPLINSATVVKRTQADHLPTFMKLGKNRDKIVKLLKKMQER